jgi:peptidoglycan/xylan/chitin deacetylase (PgdA/CDA1 family)
MVIDPLSLRLLRRAGRVPAVQGQGPLVLMYHSVSAGLPDSRWSVSAKNLRDQLDLLHHEGWNCVCVRDLAMPDALPPRTVAITFDDGFADNYDLAFPVLAERRMKATWFVVSRDIGKMSAWVDAGVPVRRMLDTDQLVEMASAGMEIGAHTRTHARLPELSEAGIREEVAGSRKDLEEMLGLPVTSFAYPYGIFNEDSVAAVRKAGFTVACTTRPGWLGSERDLFLVRRVGVFADDSLSVFARKLTFADYNVSWRRLAGRLVDHVAGRGCV